MIAGRVSMCILNLFQNIHSVPLSEFLRYEISFNIGFLFCRGQAVFLSSGQFVTAGTIIIVQSDSVTTDFVFAGYKRVEYIQSSGNEYINTNYVPQSNTRFYIRASTQGVEGHTGLFGCRNNNYANVKFLSYIENTYNNISKVIRVDVGNKTGDTGYRWTANTPFTIDIDLHNNRVQVNGNTVYNSISYSSSGQTKLCLFCNNSYGEGYMFPIAGRIYECKIYQAGSLIRDFYPVYRKQDNVVGLFDSLNKVFYTNISGVGSFTKGPDIN